LALFLFPNPQPKEKPKSPEEANAMNAIDEPPPYSKDNNGVEVEIKTKKKRIATSRRQLALVDRHARTGDDGKTATPIGVIAKICGTRMILTRGRQLMIMFRL
jgi:hypothetical protein